jgi:3-oxo-5-alpha-steroid 4-dehydrogenase 1
MVHYINRTMIFPLRMRGGKPSKFMTFIMALVFCSANGYLQMRGLTLTPITADDPIVQLRIFLGAAVWVAGIYINTEADDILRNLRKPGDTGYKIPHGGMFEYVSGANFFGEIVEWSGFAIACSAGEKSWLPALCFALCTAMNIGPRALQHHSWYLKKFDDYPPDRKALIPFLL